MSPENEIYLKLFLAVLSGIVIFTIVMVIQKKKYEKACKEFDLKMSRFNMEHAEVAMLRLETEKEKDSVK